MSVPIILASASPQRSALLKGLGVHFTVCPSAVDEAAHPELDPPKRALVLAQEKARDVHVTHPQSLVIGCDTLVVAPDGTLLEKPHDAVEARAMIARQQGGASTVHSGLCIINEQREEFAALDSSQVHFAPLSAGQMDWWVATRLWEGRSGGFQIDGLGQLLIARIEGDWTSIVGLPVYLLGKLLAQAGHPLA